MTLRGSPGNQNLKTRTGEIIHNMKIQCHHSSYHQVWNSKKWNLSLSKRLNVAVHPKASIIKSIL